MERIEALGKFLSIELEEGETFEDYISEYAYGSEGKELEYGRATYLVLTDSEADEKAIESIKDSLWAFNADFLSGETDLPEEVFSVLQEKLSEGANDTFTKLVEAHCSKGIEGFARTAISEDGRGHFLAQYDHAENVEGEYYIYRTN